MENANQTTGTTQTAVNDNAKSIHGKLTQVGQDLVDATGKPYGRALFTYVNGRGETKTLTMMAFGKAWTNVKDVWSEGQEGWIYCRYQVTEKGTTMRAISKGRAPAAKADKPVAQQAA